MLLNRYILRQIATSFSIAAGGMLFIALPGLAVGAVHKLAGVGTATVLRFLPMAAAEFVPFMLPIAFLLSVVATYGRLAAENEWTAIRMAGINPARMLRPALLMGVAVSSLILFMNTEYLPWLKVRIKTFQQDAVVDMVKNLAPGRTEVQFEDFYLFAPFREGDVFFDAFIELPPFEGHSGMTVLADEVSFDFTDTHMSVEMRGVQGVHDSAELHKAFISVAVPLDSIVQTQPQFFVDARYLRTKDLLIALRDHVTPNGETIEPERYHRYSYEFHDRVTSSLTCLMFVFIGTGTGILMRRGTQLAALAVSVGYAVMYWVLALRLGKELIFDQVIPTWAGTWGPLLICAVGGFWLIRKAFRR
ncbi:MAG: LptF/LptG family permease [Planctomycetes bacterium]|nr:LptF/LptG family permease [Planctomycetota bacterium]MCB9903411.1 LptF/LptG family permease [Planctomycetota bacterium]